MKRIIAVFALALLCSSAGQGAGVTGANTAEAQAESSRVEMQTSLGRIILELDAESAPLTVDNFLRYVDSGFYDGTIFHRVIANFMIQAGGMTIDMEEKEAGDPVRNESRNHLHNERGTIAMARTSDPHSARAQFYINVRNNLRLDFDYVSRRPGYTVFGRVVDGLEIVDAIALVETGPSDGYEDVPVDPVLIESMKRIP